MKPTRLLLLPLLLLTGCSTPSPKITAPEPEPASPRQPLVTIKIPEGFPAWVDDLQAKDYQARFDARMKIQTLMAEASAPGTDPVAIEELEDRLAQALGPDRERTARLWVVRMLEQFGGDSSVDSLAFLLDDGDNDVRDAARRALAANPSPRAGEVLAKALKDARTATKPDFVDALAYRGDPEAAVFIRPLLKSRNPRLVESAALALGKLKDKSSLSKLASLRASASDELIPALEKSMLEIGLDEKTARELAMSAHQAHLRAAAFAQLASINPSEGITMLKELAGNPEDQARTQILRAAMTSGNRDIEGAVLDLLPKLNNAEQEIILVTVSERALTGHEKVMLSFLPQSTGPARDAAIRALGATGGRASTEALYDLLMNEPGTAVIDALSQSRDAKVDQLLLATVKGQGEDTQRATAIVVLARRMPEGALAVLHDLIDPAQPEAVRKASLRELESKGDLETSRVLAMGIITPDPMKKPLQGTLKRVSVRLADPDAVWDAAFQPAFEAAPDDAARTDLLAILDGAAGPKALGYVSRHAPRIGHPLQKASVETLNRWPDAAAAGQVWLGLSIASSTTPEDIEMANQGILRALEKMPDDRLQEKYDFALRALSVCMDADQKRNIIATLKTPDRKMMPVAKMMFSTVLSDPDIGREAHILLGLKPPEPPPVAEEVPAQEDPPPSTETP